MRACRKSFNLPCSRTGRRRIYLLTGYTLSFLTLIINLLFLKSNMLIKLSNHSPLQIFDMFDVKRKGVIDFGDFVRSLNVFHPNASLEDKIDCKFTT